jgi:ABC-2 type transport system permease protein
MLPGWLPASVIEAITSFSFFTHFDGLSKGLLEARDLVFFFSLMALALFANGLVLEIKKAE